MQVKITSFKALAGGAMIIADVSHGLNKVVSSAEFHAGLQQLTRSNMMAVAGSFQVIESSPYRTLVRGAAIPTKDVIRYQEGMAGFRSLSKSIYEDDNDNMWSLTTNADGKYLVRANNVDNATEINELMASLCSSPVPGSDNAYFSAVASAEHSKEEVQSGDFALYLQKGELRAGIVLASVSADGSDALAVLAPKEEELDIIDPDQIMTYSSLSSAPELSGLKLTVPEHLTAEAGADATVDKLVSFYQKVYGFNRTYWDKFEAIIRGHAWA